MITASENLTMQIALPESLERELDRFEAAWQERVPPIAEFVPQHAGDSDRTKLLCELVQIDLRRRWASRSPVGFPDTTQPAAPPLPLEFYLRQFDGLCEQELLNALAETEYQLRFRAGETADWTEYAARFPELADEIEQRRAEQGRGRYAARYQMRESIGKGGMAEVFRAEEAKLDRPLAVKILRADRAGDSTAVWRFLAESQITARLQHPGIPPVHETGTLPDGRPFFSMKLVEGQTLDKRLTERERTVSELPALIEIFEQICRTVAYAHSQAVVHRDLKPQNVMVGAFGEVQVMDWGMARELDRELRPAGSEISASLPPISTNDATAAESSLVEADPLADTVEQTATEEPADPPGKTTIGTVMGTPAYMPPEQALGDTDAINERSDVFSLGAILCEILTGSPPYRGESPLAILQQARAGDVRSALEAIATSATDDDLKSLAADCLSVDPAARPADAERVAARVRAYRESVEQRLRQTAADRAAAEARTMEQKKRSRVWIGLVCVLFVGVVVSSVFAVIAENARDDEAEQRGIAETNEGIAKEKTNAANAANAQTQKRLTQIEKGANLFLSIFAGFDPREDPLYHRSLRESLKERLARAADQLDGEAIADPLVTAKLQNGLGEALNGLGEFRRAIALLEKSYRTRRDLLGERDRLTLVSRHNLANAYLNASDFPKAIGHFEAALAGEIVAWGSTHPHTVTCMHNLASAYHMRGDTKRAIAMFRRVLQLRKAAHGEDHPSVVRTQAMLAVALAESGQRTASIGEHERALEKLEAKLGRGHADVLTARNNLAMAYRDNNRLEEAIALFKENLKLEKHLLGRDHPSCFYTCNNLAETYTRANKLKEAAKLFESTLEESDARLGKLHNITLAICHNYAKALLLTMQPKEAIALYERALAGREKVFGVEHYFTITTRGNLGFAYCGQGQFDKGIPLIQQAFESARKQHGEQDRYVVLLKRTLAQSYLFAKRPKQAIPLFKSFLDDAKKQFGENDHRTLMPRDRLASLYAQVKDYESEIQLRTELVDLVRKQLSADDPRIIAPLSTLGVALYNARRHMEAEPVLREALRRIEKFAPRNTRVAVLQASLGSNLYQLKRYTDAEPLLAAAYDSMASQQNPDSTTQSLLGKNAAMLALIHAVQGKSDESALWIKRIGRGTLRAPRP